MPLGLDDASFCAPLKQFTSLLEGCFGSRLLSVILYGSVVWSDLAPGYGDLDFLAVVADELSEATCRRLTELRQPLRNGEYGPLAVMLEGAFLPRRLLDPAHTGSALWWGTSGERRWQRNELGWLTLHEIREQGVVIWGQDVRSEIPQIGRERLLPEVRWMCASMAAHARSGRLHSVDWLLTAARGLLLIRESRFASKSDAADWAYQSAQGEWRRDLPRAKALRLDPGLMDSPATRAWLDGLDGSIRAACQELSDELAQQGF